MSSLVHSVVSEVISSHQRLQQQQQQQQSDVSQSSLPLLSNQQLDSNNNAGINFSTEGNKQKSMEEDSNTKSTTKASSSGEKYSLRPRSCHRRLESDDTDVAGFSTGRGNAKRGTNATGGTGNRTKHKPPPLSKYRRKTANARERDRMREINAAFETLRRAVPHISLSAHQNQHDNSGSEKLTKITTLRLAMKYIEALSQALQQPQTLIQMSEFRTPCSINNSSSNISSGSLQLTSDGETFIFGERHCLTPPDLRHHSYSPPDFPRHCLTSANVTRLPSSDHSRKRGIAKPDNKQSCLSSSDLPHHCLRSSPLSHVVSQSQRSLVSPNTNIVSSELNISLDDLNSQCLVPTSSSNNLCLSPSNQNLDRHCLLSSELDQQCHPSSSDSSRNISSCLTAPVMSRTCEPPPDLSHHVLTPVDFEEHPADDHSSLLVFDDDSLNSPDLDHLLIS